MSKPTDTPAARSQEELKSIHAENKNKRAQLDNFVEERITKLPGTAKAALASRRELFDGLQQQIQVRGDAIVFLLQKNSTNDALVENIVAAKRRISEIIQQGDSVIDHIEISYPHLSFSSTIAPSSIPKYLETKLKQTPQVVEKISDILQEFIEEKITCKAKECKMNPDGHIVARLEINEKEKLLECRSKLSQALSTDGKSENLYDRYKDDPTTLEKQTTLASVLLTVDFDALSETQKQQITQELQALNKTLQKVGNIKLDSVVWKEYGVRNLSEDATFRTRQFDRRSVTDEEMAQSAFGQGSNVAKAMLKREAANNSHGR